MHFHRLRALIRQEDQVCVCVYSVYIKYSLYVCACVIDTGVSEMVGWPLNQYSACAPTDRSPPPKKNT